MILLTALLTALITALVIIGVIVFTGGIAFTMVFGDVIVCTVLIIWIIKILDKRRKKH